MRSLLVALQIAGAYTAFLIGSGFATGQEIVQFFAGYGLAGVAGCLVFLVVGTWLAVSLLLAGHRHGLHNSDQVFRHYAGPTIGAAWGWYTVLTAYSVYVVMLAGTGAVVRERLGVSAQSGAAAMAFAVYLALFFGLHELIRVIGSIGPLLVLLVLFIALTALLEDPGRVQAGDAVVGSQPLLRAAPDWWRSGILYTAMSYSGLAAFLPPLGAATERRRALLLAGIIGPLLFTLALSVCALALLAHMPEAGQAMVPMLQLAREATPRLAGIFSWIILAGIFTTAAPFLWISAVRFAADGSTRYRLVAAALGFGGYLAGIALPFDRLLNLIYPTLGWSGLLLVGFILARQLRERSID